MTGFIDQSPTKRVLDEHFLPAASTPNVRSDTEQIAASVQPDAAFSYSYICHSPPNVPVWDVFVIRRIFCYALYRS